MPVAILERSEPINESGAPCGAAETARSETQRLRAVKVGYFISTFILIVLACLALFVAKSSGPQPLPSPGLSQGLADHAHAIPMDA